MKGVAYILGFSLKGYDARMSSWIKLVVILLAVSIVGFAGAFQASNLMSNRGAFGPTILQSISPFSALIAFTSIVAVGAIVGGFVSKITSPTNGMFVFGFGLLALSINLTGGEEFLMSGGNYNLLAIEALLLSVIVLLGTLVVFAIGGPMRCIQTLNQKDPYLKQLLKIVMISFVILPVIWFIAHTPNKGQVLGALALGGIIIGLLFRQFLHSMQPVLLYALPIAIGGVGYLIGINITEFSPASFAQERMSNLLFPMPIEYSAGLVIGLAIGLGWTSSIEEHSDN